MASGLLAGQDINAGEEDLDVGEKMDAEGEAAAKLKEAERAKKEREEQEANQPDYDYSAIRTDVPAVEKKQDEAQQEDHHKDEL